MWRPALDIRAQRQTTIKMQAAALGTLLAPGKTQASVVNFTATARFFCDPARTDNTGRQKLGLQQLDNKRPTLCNLPANINLCNRRVCRTYCPVVGFGLAPFFYCTRAQ